MDTRTSQATGEQGTSQARQDTPHRTERPATEPPLPARHQGRSLSLLAWIAGCLLTLVWIGLLSLASLDTPPSRSELSLLSVSLPGTAALDCIQTTPNNQPPGCEVTMLERVDEAIKEEPDPVHRKVIELTIPAAGENQSRGVSACSGLEPTPADAPRLEAGGIGSGDASVADGFEIAVAKSPLIMKGLYCQRTSGGRRGSLSCYGGPLRRTRSPAVAVTKTTDLHRPASGLDKAEESLDGAPPADRPPFLVYNPVIETRAQPLSTFGLDVDTAAFGLARRELLEGHLPPPASIRVEEFVNAFEYAYPPPSSKDFAIFCDIARSPFRPTLDILRVGIRGRVIGRDRQKPSILTCVVDTSGSMSAPDRLDLVQSAISLLLDHLSDHDTIQIVSFGSEPRLIMGPTSARYKEDIRAAIASLQASGSTHLESGIRLGYQMAENQFQTDCLNRVLIFSDGMANLGAATAAEILATLQTYRRQRLYCSVFGVGAGAYNDAMLQALADHGDGVYYYLDSLAEAQRVLAKELSSTLHVIARDVKIQVEFYPDRVRSYRQLGYEKRHLEAAQFRDDVVDAGEIGSGQSATALYEMEVADRTGEPLGMVRIRWKNPETGHVTELAQPIPGLERAAPFDLQPPRFRLAAASAELAEWLRGNPRSSGTDGQEILKVLRPIQLELNLDGRVKECVQMAEVAAQLKGKEL